MFTNSFFNSELLRITHVSDTIVHTVKTEIKATLLAFRHTEELQTVEVTMKVHGTTEAIQKVVVLTWWMLSEGPRVSGSWAVLR